MKTSTDRFLTTHTGSLPRPVDLIPWLYQPPTEEFYALVQQAVTTAVRCQIEAGVDIISDGEQGRPGFHLYARDRLSGFEVHPETSAWMPQDVVDHPALQQRLFGSGGARGVPTVTCEGPIAMADPAAIERDIAIFRQALADRPYAEAFMTAASPGVIASTFPNRYYRDREAYLQALAAAMAHDYRAIVEADFVLQVDCPDLAMDHQLYFSASPLAEFRAHVEQSIRALNAALEGIPPERVRIHVCHGNYPGPHHLDIPLGDILDLLLTIRAQGLSLVAANSQHRASTWKAIAHLAETGGWPAGKILIPGAIDTLSPVEEGPETVAELIERYAALIGAEHVIAGSDCGFGTIVGVFENIVPSAVWPRLSVLSEGARLASLRFWPQQAARL